MNRKKFLILGSLGFSSALFPDYLFSKALSVNNSENVDINALLKQAADFSKAGKPQKAKNIYEDILKINPQEIRAYNGLRKVFLLKGKQQQVIDLYKNALKKYPENEQIKERLYKEYLRSALGNKKIAKNNGNGNGKRLLKEVRDYYKTLSEKNPENKTFHSQFKKVKNRLDWNADTGNCRKNQNLKNNKKENRKHFKQRFNGVSDEGIQLKISKLKNKPVLTERNKRIKELQRISVERQRKNRNFAQALTEAKKLYQTDKTDNKSLEIIRNHTKLSRDYDGLISVERENHRIKNNFFSALALFNALAKKAEISAVFNAGEAGDLLQKMISDHENLEPGKDGELQVAQIRFGILTNNFSQAKEKLQTLISENTGIKSAHIIDRINVLAAKYFHKTGDAAKANQILFIAMNPKQFQNESDEILSKLVSLNENRSLEKPVHLQTLRNQIEKLLN